MNEWKNDYFSNLTDKILKFHHSLGRKQLFGQTYNYESFPKHLLPTHLFHPPVHHHTQRNLQQLEITILQISIWQRTLPSIKMPHC